MPNDKQLTPWAPQTLVAVPADAEPPQLLDYAPGLRPFDAKRAMKLLVAEDYDLAAEFVWRRAISKLRATLAAFGMAFVGEMLGRDDIDENSAPERALTEYDTVRLAEQLGFVSPTGALRLQQSFETMAHFSSDKADDSISKFEAINILRNCVQYLLREPEIGMTFDFAKLRARLLSETLPADDAQLMQLLESAPFFLGTTVRVLLAGLKTEKGARIEHAARNLGQILPRIWDRLPEQERWNVGIVFAEVSAAGNTPAVTGLRHALHSVSGFDYVPENLRSNTYKRAARAVIDAHFGMNNFFTETEPTQRLAKMGTSIPKPALAECVQAFLTVYVGNRYGASFMAAPIAYAQLRRISADQWHYYLDKILPNDSVVLGELDSNNPATRFSQLVRDFNLYTQKALSATGKMIAAAAQNQVGVVISEANRLWRALKLS
jgi:hypothetical protein